MKTLGVVLLSVLVIGFTFSPALSAGDVAKGKTLFNDTQLGNNTSGKSCNSCHPDGKGLVKAGERKDLAQFANACIENALKGKPINPESQEMEDLVAYIKSLKGK
jgi:cytochrome c peroxidase